MDLNVFLLFKGIYIVNIITIVIRKAASEEYCFGEVFNPTCSDTELILMQHAQLGRMRLGRCIDEDLGYLGCSADVLPILDNACTGRASCDIRVNPLNIDSDHGCRKSLMKYLDASYICKPAQHLPMHCSTMNELVVELENSNSYISSDEIKTSCIEPNRSWKIRGSPGQSLNISLIDIHQSQNSGLAVYGLMQEPSTKREVVFGGGPREKHIMLSSESVDITIQAKALDNAHFLLHIKVEGCANIEPPEGAWMTRNGDVMEIGCHSGAKSWTMTCENNQWTGAVGQCGHEFVDESWKPEEANVTKTATLSPNAVIFAACSALILLSSIVFLIGVCLLKKNVSRSTSNHLPMDASYFPGDPLLFPGHTLQLPQAARGQVMDPSYKSLQMKTDMGNDMMVVNEQHNSGDYMNTGMSEGGGSVQYYILEDTTTK